MPANLAGDQSEPEGLRLTWDANLEDDLAKYAVYRGTSPVFTPAPGNLVGEPVDPGLFDGDWRWDGDFHYKVAAVDVHGNVSVFAILGPDLVTGAEQAGPTAVNYLGQNRPNPFGRGTRIGFGLARAGAVSVRIYDVRGRLVRVLLDEFRGADFHSVVWDGRDNSGQVVAGGVYFYRVTSGSFVQTKKLTLLR
jgi:hypothetical protein